jgi:hypothetical protein
LHAQSKGVIFVKNLNMTRNTFTLMLFVLLATKLPAQNYTPFPQSATWNEVTIFQDNPNWPNISHYTLNLIDEDTIIQQQIYRKLFYINGVNEIYSGALRETSDKRIYYYPIGDTTEHLLYQFDLKVGDTVFVHKTGNPTTVQEIDSILVGSSYRKRCLIRSPQTLFGPEYWIEGIGSTKGLLSPYEGFEFENMLWLCGFESGSVSYQIEQPSFNTYCTTSVEPIATPESNDLFPNPTHDLLNISKLAIKDQYQIFNIYGVNCTKMVRQGAEGILNVQNLNSGAYFLWSKGRYQRFVKI